MTTRKILKTISTAVIYLFLLHTTYGYTSHTNDTQLVSAVQDTTAVASEIDTTIVQNPTSMPVYPGGDRNILLDVSRAFEYPSEAMENNISGTIIAGFVVEKDGSISDITIKRGLGHGLDKAAIKAIKRLKNFEEPAKDSEGNPVRTSYTLPIRCVY